MDTATLLRRARHRAGLTQVELTERAATTQSAIAACETGARTPNLETLDRLVLACDHTLHIEARPR